MPQDLKTLVQKCAICDRPVQTAGPHTNDYIQQQCECCGTVVTLCPLFAELKGHGWVLRIADDLRPYLSAAARQASECGNPIRLTVANWRRIVEEHQRRTVTEKIHGLLAFIGEKTRSPGKRYDIRNERDYPICSAYDGDELQEYLNYLAQTGMLTVTPTGVGPNEGSYALTVKGWQEIEPRPRPGGEPGRCFIASWLSEEMEIPYRNGIEPAVRACGYRPIWMKDIPENKGITDRILSEIRLAEFVIADFTHQRQSVYFEAGFAKGLGREVIWCCRDTDVSRLHFDTKHLGHVVWSNADDLRVKLEASIRANIINKA